MRKILGEVAGEKANRQGRLQLFLSPQSSGSEKPSCLALSSRGFLSAVEETGKENFSPPALGCYCDDCLLKCRVGSKGIWFAILGTSCIVST